MNFKCVYNYIGHQIHVSTNFRLRSPLTSAPITGRAVHAPKQSCISTSHRQWEHSVQSETLTHVSAAYGTVQLRWCSCAEILFSSIILRQAAHSVFKKNTFRTKLRHVYTLPPALYSRHAAHVLQKPLVPMTGGAIYYIRTSDKWPAACAPYSLRTAHALENPSPKDALYSKETSF